jgi:GT2 family glycosyltransferase
LDARAREGNSLNSIPSVSVVVPHYNAFEHLKTYLLPALEAQTWRHFELIVADDGSPDAPRVAELLRSFNFDSARLECLAHGGAASARNGGVAAASGTIIAVTDSDCVPSPDWLETIVLAIIEHQADFAYGRVTTDSGYLFPRWAAPAGERLVSANLAFRRSAFEAIGGFRTVFDVPFREDTDFGLRALESGLLVISVPNAVVYHPLRKQSVKKLWTSGYWHRYDAELLKRFGDKVKPDIGKGYTRPLGNTGVSAFGAAYTCALAAAIGFALRRRFPTAIGIVALLQAAIAAGTIVATAPSRDERTVGEIIENGLSAIPYTFGWYVGRVEGSINAKKLCV